MKIRAGILGYGRNGSSMHAGAVEADDAFEMVAACDIDPERLKQASARFGCATYDDYHQMLAKERLDFVVIVTRSDQHCQMTCDCLDAGVAVLVTKPWAVNTAEARRMVAAADSSGKLLLPWLPSRWGSDVRRLKELIAAGTIGNVFLVRHAAGSFNTRCDWQTERRYGGGYLLNWGPHIVDTPVLLMDSKVKSVYGRMKQTINPGDVEDVFLAVLTLANGAIVQVEYTIAVEDLPSWFIQGDRGTIVVRGNDMKVYKCTPIRPDDPTRFDDMKSGGKEIIEETIEGYVWGATHEVYADIIAALRGEKKFPVAPADALELSCILEAIRTASDENRVVTL